MADTFISTVLVGEESLCLSCAVHLLERGHSLLGIVTRATPLKEWAIAHDVPVIRPGEGLEERLSKLGSFEYLLSIANLKLLSDEVLAVPTEGIINFHDGPLPRYAGLYCTSWALMSLEAQHGVTWHYVERGVDEGRILVQQLFYIAPDETALTLNARCFSMGLETFGELVEQLETGSLRPQEQDLSQRSYFAHDQRPSAMATIDWSASPDAIVALVRALDFGTYANPLAIAKVRGERLGLVGAASIIEDAKSADAPTGTVLAVGEDFVRVAVGDEVVELAALRDADGQPTTAAALGLREGERLPAMTRELAARLDAVQAQIVRHEGFWARRLALPTLRLGKKAESHAEASARLLATRDGASDAQLVAAVCAAAARVTGVEHFSIGYVDPDLAALATELDGWVAPVVPLAVDLRGDPTVAEVEASIAERLDKTRQRITYTRDLPARTPSLGPVGSPSVVVAVGLSASSAVGDVATFHVAAGEVRALFGADVSEPTIGRLTAAIDAFFEQPERPVHDLPLLTAQERAVMLADAGRTATAYDRTSSVHSMVEAQVDRTPARVALVMEGQELTYAALDARANQLAHRLREHGVERGSVVGLHLERSLDMVVAMLGIQKAGGAYLPLDPAYPRERLLYMLKDSAASIVVNGGARGLVVDGVEQLDLLDLGDAPTGRVEVAVSGEDLAYVIYTSGSTGKPKGVMVEHRNVSNFFAGMDQRVSHEGEVPGVWLAVTSPSFDISVLELSWTLARGFTVLLHRDRRAEAGGTASGLPMDFGLCFWGNDDGPGRGKYRFLLEGAKAADANGFHSVWTPERHFHAFGGPYANAAVSGAAVAAVTKNVAIRSCSVVLPLHHPVRVAEEWSMVDNMCDGRVGLGVASGWQPDDFILRPENAPSNAKDAMFRDIEVLRRLWRGEAVEFPKADGTMHPVVTQPRPVQAELPIWLTIAGNPKTFVQAAEAGAFVLTHLLGQSVAELAEKIKAYRDRRAELGMDEGKVALMLHTFVDPDREVAREATRGPLKSYFASAASLIKQYVWMFPAMKRPEGADAPENIDLATVSAEDIDAVLEYAFARYFEESGLLGNVDDCVARVEQLKAIGVDEIGCLVDYGVDTDRMLASLPHLFEVSRRTARPAPVNEESFEQLITERGATHLQCTPSMARMLLADPAAKAALAKLQHVMVGGEALPTAVARGLRDAGAATLTNMYGPTETTIWSSTDDVDPADITIGKAIANTALYVLDARRRLVPPGAVGELYIAGDGVTRGYLHREELTAERFVPDPFAGGGARMYRTGDLARRREDGRLDFLGRVDHQVKFRGYRIELGEIESALEDHEGVTGAVVVARDTGVGESQLVAYIVGSAALDPGVLRQRLSTRLPAYMIPGRVVTLDRFPLTPNGKVDRAALPDPAAVASAKAAHAEPESEVEETIAGVWQKVLGISHVGRSDNFFDLGGHSLLAVSLLGELNAVVETKLSMIDIFRFPTVASLAERVGGGGDAAAELERAASRASERRKAQRGGRARRTLGRRS